MSDTQNRFNFRYSKAPWMSLKTQVTIGGIGGIGSNVATVLSAFNTELLIYEFDTVDIENCGPQNYDQRHIGKTKIDAFRERMEEKIGESNVTITDAGKMNTDSMVTPICIACFDSMDARNKMFKAWNKLMGQYYKQDGKIPDEAIFIDGRMTAELYEVFTIRTPQQAKVYNKDFMFSDSEVADLNCSYKSTPHCSMGITNRIIQCYVNHLSNVSMGIDARLIPFHIRFDGLMFKEDITW